MKHDLARSIICITPIFISLAFLTIDTMPHANAQQVGPGAEFPDIVPPTLKEIERVERLKWEARKERETAELKALRERSANTKPLPQRGKNMKRALEAEQKSLRDLVKQRHPAYEEWIKASTGKSKLFQEVRDLTKYIVRSKIKIARAFRLLGRTNAIVGTWSYHDYWDALTTPLWGRASERIRAIVNAIDEQIKQIDIEITALEKELADFQKEVGPFIAEIDALEDKDPMLIRFVIEAKQTILDLKEAIKELKKRRGELQNDRFEALHPTI